MSEGGDRIQVPIGTRDVLGDEAARHRAITGEFGATAELYGFRPVSTPVFESSEVFRRAGESADAVSKEMYEFEDKGGRPLALRPEGTAAICRAFASIAPTIPWKVWYEGPFFRYESPQAGRYRQFSQVGLETIGTDDSDADVEVIACAVRFLKGLGLESVGLSVNSLGGAESRGRYIEALAAYLSGRAAELDPEDRDRIDSAPLRVLDSKRERSAAVTAEAPVMSGFLTAGEAARFEKVTGGLEDLGIDYRVDSGLVRGLDYYTCTAFELQSAALGGAQNAIGGGGRYDGLVKALGGPAASGVGFAIGVERLLLACDAEGVFGIGGDCPYVYVVDVCGGNTTSVLSERFRSAGVSCERSFGGRSMRSQMKSADRSGATFAVIIGPDELSAEEVSLRALRGADGATRQARVPLSDIVRVVKELIQ